MKTQRTNSPVNAHLISGPNVNDHCHKIGQGQLRVTIYIHFLELEYIMLHVKFQDHKTISSREQDFKGFYHIHVWAWLPSWSCDTNYENKCLSPLPKEAPHKIWLSLAKQFQRRKCLKIMVIYHGRLSPSAQHRVVYRKMCRRFPVVLQDFRK